MYIRILAFMLFFQAVLACGQVQGNTGLLEANLAGQSFSDSSRQDKKAPHPAVNVIFQSLDGGQTWKDISAGLPVFSPVESFFAQNGEVYLGYEEGLYHSQDLPADHVWEKSFTINGLITGVFQGREGVYAHSMQDGFYHKLSNDIWSLAFPEMKNRSVRTMLETPDGTIFVGCDNGMFKSGDQGKTWKQVFADGIILNIVSSDGVLLAGGQQGILRSTDNGEHWDWVLSEGGVGISTECIKGGFAAITYNTQSETRRVRISADGGKTWLAIDAGLPPSASIASIIQVGEDFYCGHPNGIYRSSDRGKTWKLVLPAIGKKVFNLVVSGKVIYAIPQDGGC